MKFASTFCADECHIGHICDCIVVDSVIRVESVLSRNNTV